MSLHYATLHHTIPHHTTLHYTAPRHTVLHYTPLHYTTHHGWQSESTDGPKGGVVFSGVVAMFAVVIAPQLLDVVWCSTIVVVVVVVVECSGVVVVMWCN